MITKNSKGKFFFIILIALFILTATSLYGADQEESRWKKGKITRITANYIEVSIGDKLPRIYYPDADFTIYGPGGEEMPDKLSVLKNVEEILFKVRDGKLTIIKVFRRAD